MTITPAVSSKTIVKKIVFRPKSKKLRVGKKLNIMKYLVVTYKQAGKVKVKFEFTKKKYKKYASLSSKGIVKAKKKGRKKTIYIRVRALDGSKKTAKIKIKIT